MLLTAALGVFSLALLVGLGVYLAPLDPHLVALQFSFTQESFGTVLSMWGPAGVARFRSHLPVDGLLLLGYGMFGYRLAGLSPWLGVYSPANRRMLAWLLPLAALGDAGENVMHWLLTAPQAGYPAWAYALAGACASLKWCGLLVFAAAVVWAFRKRRSHPTEPTQ